MTDLTKTLETATRIRESAVARGAELREQAVARGARLREHAVARAAEIANPRREGSGEPIAALEPGPAAPPPDAIVP
jgi:hypothetical protein